MAQELKPGLSGESYTVITEFMTARAQGSGTLDVYATPAMVALMEAAACNAIEATLDEGMTTVGIEIRVQHLAASPVGEEVRALAEVTAVDGRRIVFDVRAWDERELIGEGVHVRYLIDTERFMNRVRSNE
ncbi:MAG: thioesterase family protein [Anaerolineae bacterium]|nr:thioesterase family protein [Anaerolineae bacterium]